MATNQSTILVEQKLTDGTTELKLTSPYHPDFPSKARAIGGRWHSATKTWRFDLRDARRVRNLCLETFGLDPLAEPDDEPDLVTVQVAVSYADEANGSIWLFGRELAARRERDYRVALGGGVVVVSGGFPSSGGSRKNPSTAPESGTVLEVRDVPRTLVEQEIAQRRQQAAREVELAPDSWRAKRATERAQAITIIETDPEPERIAPALEQFVALAKALSPAQRRTALVSLLGLMDADERRAAVDDIAALIEQAK